MRALPEAVERLEPPPELRERLMAEVLADAAAERRRAGRAGGAPARAAWRRLGSARGWRPLAGLAALALVVAAVAGYVDRRRRL